ncbi:plasmid pRiA4b ORF-3 family protein [Mesorhizobium sp. 1B3]|uniref:plasmid pRiA4b ORF-3 family protein n=1 Tax=Mesorhizobium sp. 1B3 TaxID=3243599 RepID=UPI003D97E002
MDSDIRRSSSATNSVPDEQPTILQFRIWLKGVSPMIWRRVQVPSTMTLREFHGVLQVAMGWEGIHLYQFTAHTVRYGSWETAAASADIVLDALTLRKSSRFLYEYDLNIPWEQEVRLEESRSPKPGTHYPCCIGSDGNCPPEDSGGPDVWMRQRDTALGLEQDEDVATALEFIAEINDAKSLAIFDNPSRREELRELLDRIKKHIALTGRPYERREVNKRPRQDEHLTLMHQQI